MIEAIKNTFIEEATSQLTDVERRLEANEAGQFCPELAEVVFRTMHSLKGSGPMFGFDQIPDFVIPVEKVYREMLDKQQPVDEETKKKTFELVIFLKSHLISEPEQKNGSEAKLLDYFNNLCRA